MQYWIRRRGSGDLWDMGMTETLQRVFFHIGLHKTATTWLQVQLFPNLEGVKLIRTRNIAKVMAVMRSGDPGTLIVSHEGMSGKIGGNAPGDSEHRLTLTLQTIASKVPQAAIIVGFREQSAWINSAFAQRARKSEHRADDYVQGFSLDELSWCRVLRRIKSCAAAVFPFLHEELDHDGRALVEDLCRFLGASPPADLETILKRRVNTSPRSKAGRRVSRTVYGFSRWLANIAHPTIGKGSNVCVSQVEV